MPSQWQRKIRKFKLKIPTGPKEKHLNELSYKILLRLCDVILLTKKKSLR